MHTVARYDVKAGKNDTRATMGKIYDAASDKGRYSFPDLSKFTAQAEVFTSSPWVYIAVDLVAKNCGLVELLVYQLGDKRKLIENHPLHQLMRRPNGHMTQSEFVYAMVASRILAGNAYLYLVSANGGAPDEILLLRPDAVKIVPGTNGKRIDGYLYQVAGTDPIPIEPEQIIHWKGWHPLDPYYGLSLVQVMALSVQAEKGMSTWQAKFFSKENAVPAGILALPPTISSDDYKDFKESWYRAYGGTQRATAIIRANDFQYHPIGTNHVDMDFMQGRLFEKEVILNCVGVPVSIFAVNANEANARAGLELLTGFTIWPAMVSVGQKFTTELMPFWDGSGNLICEPDDIRIKDERAELQQMQADGSIMSINEIRDKYRGLPAVEWGDRPPAGAQATPGGGIPAFGKPKVDASAQQIEAQDQGVKRAALKSGQDCYVLLSLANEPSIVGIIETLKKQRPDVEWEDPADLHVTLVYATNVADIQAIQDILPHSIKPIALTVGPLDSFDSNNGKIPLILRVKTTPTLTALQSGLAASFQSLGLDLSPYSVPSAWQPHVTLGYMAADASMPSYPGTVNVSAKGITASVSNGDDFNLVYFTKTKPSDELEQYINAVARHEVLTSASKRELQRFATFATKRLWAETKEFASDEQRRAFFGLLAGGEIGSGRGGNSDNPARPYHSRGQGAVSQGEELGTGGGSAYAPASTAINDQYLERRIGDKPATDKQRAYLQHLVDDTQSKADQEMRDMQSNSDVYRRSFNSRLDKADLEMAHGVARGMSVPHDISADEASSLIDKLKEPGTALSRSLGIATHISKAYSYRAQGKPVAREHTSSLAFRGSVNYMRGVIGKSENKRGNEFLGFWPANGGMRSAPAKAVENFHFNDTPAAYQILARAYGDVAQDADELARMIEWHCGTPLPQGLEGHAVAKAILPASRRVSTSGKLDPLAKEKTAAANRLQAVTSTYLAGLRSRIADHAEHQPTSGFWNGERQNYQQAVSPVVKAGLAAFLASLAALYSMQFGVDLDEEGLKTDADSLYGEWVASIPGGIVATTKAGIDAIYQRWRDMPDATPDDLTSALDQSYLFSPDRADAIAETETTRSGFKVTRITAQDVANSLDVPFANDDVSGPPIHTGDRCFTSTTLKTDDNGDPTGVDQIWHTVNDSHVCDICAPLDGLTFSEIAMQGAEVAA